MYSSPGAPASSAGASVRSSSERAHAVRALVRDPARAGGAEGSRESRSPSAISATRRRSTRRRRGVDTVFHFAAVFRKEVPRQEDLGHQRRRARESISRPPRGRGSRGSSIAAARASTVCPLKRRRLKHSPFMPIRGDLYQETKLAAEEHVRRFGSEGRLGGDDLPHHRGLRPRRPALPQALSRRSRGECSRCPGGARSCSR